MTTEELRAQRRVYLARYRAKLKERAAAGDNAAQAIIDNHNRHCREYYVRHREQVLEKKQAEYHGDLEGSRAYNRAYYELHRKRILAQRKRARLARIERQITEVTA